MIVSKPTQDALMELIKQCFVENRKFDRMVSVLGVKFACNNSADLIHHNIAHYYPALSDSIGELCLERYNIPVVYGATPSGTEDFGSVKEIIFSMRDRSIEFQTMFMGACRIALDNNDLHVYADLSELLSDYNRIVDQTILLADKIEAYPSVMSFDHDVKTFWKLEAQA